MNNSPAMPQELASQLAGPWASAGCCTSRPCGAGGERPGTARHSLAALTGTKQLAAAGHRARSPRITTRRGRVARAAGRRGLRRDPLPGLAQGARARLETGRQQVLRPRLARADRRRRTGSGPDDPVPRRPPARATGRDRGPGFAHGFPARGHDVEHPYEPLALALLVSWIKLALADERHAALLAPPLIDLIGRVPKPQIPRDLGINWPLEPSEPHIRPRRR